VSTRRRLVEPGTLHTGEGALVFAFGSNLREEQMRARCPSAKVIEVGRLPGHTLAFVGFSRTWGGAVATAERCKGDSVEGVIYRVSADDLARLDAFEGVPFVYRRVAVQVRGAKHTFRCWIYQHARPVPGAPSYRYFAAVLEGRLRHGLSAEPVLAAAEAGADAAPF